MRQTSVQSEGEREGTTSRSALVRSVLTAGGVLLVGGVAVGETAPPAAAASPAQDVRILNFVLLLEELEAAFYAEALDRGALRGELREFATVVSEHERAHVTFLRGVLGANARKRPRFAFGNATRAPTRFATAAVVIEDSSSFAYVGQAANLTRGALGAAARIASVEARHAAWIRDIVGVRAAPSPVEPARTARQVQRELEKHGLWRIS